MSSNFSFVVTDNDVASGARCGVLHTPHGDINTPNFVFCGTKGALKSMTTSDLDNCGAEVMLSNTYHLLLQPGADIVAKNGGLHKMINWKNQCSLTQGDFKYSACAMAVSRM